MGDLGLTRRLAAVLIGDIAGYSRLMERDEGGTHVRLRAIRSAVIDPAIARHTGRLVRTTGDGLLCVFSSAADAFRCAVEIQRELAQHELGEASDRRIMFRFGLNIGDIIEDGDDIAGDGVNVAARLEALCTPGEICISALIREHVRDMRDVRCSTSGRSASRTSNAPFTRMPSASTARGPVGRGV